MGYTMAHEVDAMHFETKVYDIIPEKTDSIEFHSTLRTVASLSTLGDYAHLSPILWASSEDWIQ